MFYSCSWRPMKRWRRQRKQKISFTLTHQLTWTKLVFWPKTLSIGSASNVTLQRRLIQQRILRPTVKELRLDKPLRKFLWPGREQFWREFIYSATRQFVTTNRALLLIRLGKATFRGGNAKELSCLTLWCMKEYKIVMYLLQMLKCG